MSIAKTATTLLALFCVGCGPSVSESTSGGADGGGDVGSQPDAGTEQASAWAIGIFHDPQWLGRGAYAKMYELRPDGTGVTYQEGCQEGVMGPYEDFAWRVTSDTTVEVFGAEGAESFYWMRGPGYDGVTLTKIEDGKVSADDVAINAFTIYERGRICITERVPASDCRDIGFLIEPCEE